MAKLAILISCALLLAVTCHAGYYNNPPSPTTSCGLQVGYYKSQCPNAEAIVKQVVGQAVRQNPGIGAGLIRMLFHDCFVQGCDASVLLDPTPGNPQPEKLSPPNFRSLRGFEVIDAAKEALEKACPGIVSCADIVAFAARDASSVLSYNKVSFDMPAGRLDGRVSLASKALTFLPPPSFNLTELIAGFAAKGLDTEDMVVLSGAHTVGSSHCSSFSDRLSSSNSDVNPSFAATLRNECPANPTANNNPTVVQDSVTPNTLDSQYYKNVINHRVLFTSDASLLTSRTTAEMVSDNANIPGWWEGRFENAMVKLAGIEVKTGNSGEIRKKCSVVN